MTELRRRMLEELRLRNHSPNTIDTYIRCVGKFAQHFGLPPDRLGPEHVRQYQLFLVQRKKVAWAVFNQTVCALRFFYHHILHRDWPGKWNFHVEKEATLRGLVHLAPKN